MNGGTPFEWRGILPGKTTLADAIARLGRPEGQDRSLNATTYRFDGGRIRLTVIDGQEAIGKVRLDGKLAGEGAIPGDIDAATSQLGPLKLTRRDRLDGLIFERPFVRVACDENPQPERVRWIEYFA